VAALLEAMWRDALWKLKLEVELEETRRGPKRAGPLAGKKRKKES
jgi:hypothetical protein